MTILQKTIFGTSEPVKLHRDDPVVCSDDTVCRHEDVRYDVAGRAHSNVDDRFDANVASVRKILKATEEWSDDYHTGGGDYPDGYGYIVHELSREWPEHVSEWLRNEFEEIEGSNPHADYMDELVKHICEDLDDFEPEYNSCEYSCYSGDGCCLWSLDVGECEEQIDITGHPELMALHDLRELDDVLDELDNDFCIGRSKRRVKNEKTGHYENVGRDTYMPYEHDVVYPVFEIYTMPGGIWHFVVSAERMNELVSEFLEDRSE